jgi:antitoxin component YwqK of YwqJK toxin-antitoxin module
MLRLFYLSLISLTISNLQAQELRRKFLDENWIYWNTNVRYIWDNAIGSAIKEGIDAEYVDDKLDEQNPLFHDNRGFFIQSDSYIDFTLPGNRDLWEFEFDDGQRIGFPELFLFITKKYSNAFTDDTRKVPILTDQINDLVDSLDLYESKRAIVREMWYFDKEERRFYSRLAGIGLLPPKGKDRSPVMWIEFQYIELKILERIRPKNYPGMDDLISYVENATWQREVLSWSHTQFERQKKPNRYNTELDVYFQKLLLEQTFSIESSGKKLKSDWKGKQTSGTIDGEGNMSGLWTLLDEKGNRLCEMQYYEGIAEGQYRLFYPNGKVKESGTLRNGMKQGATAVNNTTGNVIASKNYENGLLEGELKWYYDNGLPHTVTRFQNGVVHGPFKRIYPDGVIREQGRFDNGIFAGDWKYNIKMEDVFCEFLKDQEAYGYVSKDLVEGAMEDCIASFVIYFFRKTDKACYGGFCVLPELKGKIE